MAPSRAALAINIQTLNVFNLNIAKPYNSRGQKTETSCLSLLALQKVIRFFLCPSEHGQSQFSQFCAQLTVKYTAVVIDHIQQ